MKFFFLLILFLVSFNTISEELPELGSSFDSLINSADVKKIKFKIMQQVYSSNTVIRDPEINDYINSLGKNLVNSTIEKPDLNFFIVDDSTINAFAMLGDVIGIHSGLIFAANTESELASVLSHEIAHITQKHLLRLFDSQSKNSYKTYLAIAVAILAARSNPQLASGAMTVASASQAQNMLDYTRANEKEADRIGLQILDKAGFDTKGFVDFFSTLDKFNNFSSGPAPTFLRTHPVTIERISDIQDRLKNYKYIQKENKLEFYLTKAKLISIVGNNRENINKFKNEIKDKRLINEKASYFGLAYSFLKNNQIMDARKTFNDANLADIDSPMIIELDSKILIEEKKYEKAFALYKKGINKYPYYRAFIFGIADMMINSKMPLKAIDFLKKYQLFFNNDPILYSLLAKSYSLQRELLLEHENLSDYFYYQFDIENAIIQMDLAVKTNSANFYDQSRVEYRLKELKRESELMNN